MPGQCWGHLSDIPAPLLICRSAGGTFAAQGHLVCRAGHTSHLLLAWQPPPAAPDRGTGDRDTSLPQDRAGTVTATGLRGWGQGERNKMFPWGKRIPAPQTVQNHTNHRILSGSREETNHDKLVKCPRSAPVSCPVL